MSAEIQDQAFAARMDEQDLERVRGGDPSGFDGLVERHYRAAYGVALAYLRDPEAAEEAAQEAFLRAFLSLDTLREAAAFVPWLVSIARHAAIDWGKRAQRRSRLLPMIPMEELLMEPLDPHTRSPREHLEEEQAGRLVREAILQLPDALREVVVLHYGEEMNKSAIAEALGVHPSTIARQLERALEELRRVIEPQLTASLQPLRSRPAATKVTATLLAGTLALSATSKAALAAAVHGTPSPLPPGAGAPAQPGSLPGPRPSTHPAPPAGAAKSTSSGVLGSGTLRLLLLLLSLLVATPVLYTILRPSRAATTSSRAAAPPARLASARGSSPPARSRDTQPSSGASRRRKAAVADAPTSGPRLVMTGRVLRPDGTPATGAEVGLLRMTDLKRPSYDVRFEPAVQALTDTDGYYRLETADSIAFSLYAREKGSGPTATILVDQQVQRQGARLEGERSIKRDLKLTPAASVAGRLLDEEGKPLPGLRVLAAPIAKDLFSVPPALSATTSEDGSFAFADLPTGKVELRTEVPGHVPFRKVLTAPAANVDLTLSAKGSRVAGRVSLKEGGAPLAGVAVSLLRAEKPPHLSFPLDTSTATTDDAGRFTVDHLAAGSYLLRCRKGGYMMLPPGAREGHLIQVGEDTTTDGMEIPLYSGHTVSGTVKEKGSGVPVEGASITFEGTESVTVVTDAAGHYEARGISTESGRTVRYRVSAPGYRLVPADPLVSTERVELTASSTEIVRDLQMEKADSITGHVRDENGRPIPKAKVLVHSGPGTPGEKDIVLTGPDGRFELMAPAKEIFYVKAYAPGRPVVLSRMLHGGETVNDLELVAGPGTMLRVTVLDPSGKPVPGALVRMETDLPAGTISITEQLPAESTNDEGVLEAKNVPLLPLSVSAEKGGFPASAFTSVTPSAAGGPANSVTLTLQAPLELSGRVTGADGKPLENVLVYAMVGGSQPQVRTDAQGHYRLKPLPAGAVTVYLKYQSGTISLSDQIDGVQVGRSDADFVLKEKDKVECLVKVLDWKSKQPVANFTVTDYYSGAAEKDKVQPGLIRLPGLPGYGYYLKVESPGYAPADFQMLIPTDRRRMETTLLMGPGGTLTGRVVDGAGNPVSGARIELANVLESIRRSVTKPLLTTQSAADGQFRLEGVPEGRRSLVVSLPGTDRSRTIPVECRHGETADLKDVTLGHGAVLSGRLVQIPGDNGISGVTVELASVQKGPSPRSAVTDAGGGFLFEGLPAGRYRLRSSRPAQEMTVWLAADERHDVLLRSGEAALAGTLTRCGKPESGKVILRRGAANQEITREVTAGPDGRFRAEGLFPGRWELTAIPSSGTGARDLTKSVEVGSGESEVTLEMPCGSGLQVTVLGADGAPVRGATVTALSPDFFREHGGAMIARPAGVTDEQGRLTVPLSPGSHSVTATASDGATAQADRVEIPESGEPAPLTLRLSRNGGTLVSTTRTPDGTPLLRLETWIVGEKGLFLHNRTRDEHGVLTVPSIPPGRYRVILSTRSEAVHDVEIRDGETVTLEDTLGPGNVLRWTFADEQGDPVSGIPIRITGKSIPAGEAAREVKTNSSGMAMIFLPEGEYTAVATPPGHDPLTVTTQVEEHVEHPVNTVLR